MVLPQMSPTTSQATSLLMNLPKICVAVAGPTLDAMQATSADLLPVWPFQEFRLDYLTRPAEHLPALEHLLAANPDLVLLATCRPERSGGRLQGGADDEMRVLLGAAEAGAKLVDLSLESAEELGSSALAALRQAGAAVVISYHNFNLTGDLDATLARLRQLRPDLCKLVPTAEKLQDSVRLLRLLREEAAGSPTQTPTVAISMGEPGLITRVLGPREGSLFTFAAGDAAEATAPGQLSAATLRDLYRAPSLGPQTRVFAVAGDPVHSSLSPLMHNTAFRLRGMDAVYLPLKTGDATELFQAAEMLPLAGCSVTMPLKQSVQRFLAEVEPLAKRIGAINTLVRREDGQYLGYNTDAAGITEPLEKRIGLEGARVLVLGAGGAARAAVFSCADRGAEVFITNRTPEAALQLAREAGATALPRAELRDHTFDVLIHATPAGMRGSSLLLPLHEDELRARLVFDLVYNPMETPLLALAQQMGLETIPGVEMFVHQGARQFELWTGQPAPMEAMRAAVLAELARPAAATGPPQHAGVVAKGGVG